MTLRKKYFSVLLLLCILFLNMTCSASEDTFADINGGTKINVNGFYGSENAGKEVSVLLINNNSYNGGTADISSIGHIASPLVDADGRLSYSFEFEGNVEDYSLYTKVKGSEKKEIFLDSEVNDTTSYSKSGYIVVRGNVGEDNKGKNVTVMLIKNGNSVSDKLTNIGFGHFGTCKVSDSGEYYYKFKFAGDLSEYGLYTKVDGERVQCDSIELLSENDDSIEAHIYLKNSENNKLDLTKDDYGYIYADIKNLFENSLEYTAIISFYDEKGKMISCDMKNGAIDVFENSSEAIEELSCEIPAGTSSVKLFIWKGEKTMVPLGAASEYYKAENEKETFYVSSSKGNDANDGSISAPFKSLNRAKQAVRNLKLTTGLPSGGVTVYLRDGEYPVSECYEFNELDSGSDGRNIVYTAYPGEKPVFTGGLTIDDSDFSEVTDEKALGILPDSNNVLCVDLKNYGFYDYGTWEHYGEGAGLTNEIPCNVYINGKKMDIASYPNRDENDRRTFVNVDTVIASKAVQNGDTTGSTFTYTDERIESWHSIDGVSVEGMFPYTYRFEGSAIEKADFNSNQITLKYPSEWGMSDGNRYRYVNVFDELDCENEYYIDRKTGILYIYKPAEDFKVEISNFGRKTNEYAFLFNNASNITLSGIEISNLRCSAVGIKESSNILVTDCFINNIGGIGVEIGDSASVRGKNVNQLGDTGSKAYYENKNLNCGVSDSIISSVGYQGVSIHGGDRYTLEKCNHFVENCIIEKTGEFAPCQGNAVELFGCGITMKNCTVRDIPSIAVNFGGNYIIMEQNDVSDCLYIGNDLGAFYSCAYDAEVNLGSEVKYNYIHDISFEIIDNGEASVNTVSHNDMSEVPMRVGVYNDFCDPFLEVHHNVIENTPVGIFNLSGAENNWINNIFIDTAYPMPIRYNNHIYSYFKELGDSDVNEDELFSSENFLSEYSEFSENPYWLAAFENKIPDAMSNILTRKIEGSMPSSTIKNNVGVYINKQNFYYNKGTDENLIYPTSMWNVQTTLEYCDIDNNCVYNSSGVFKDYENGDYTFATELSGIEAVDISAIGVNEAEIYTVD